MKTLIIGRGEVGNSLAEVLSPHYETHIRDVDPLPLEGIEVLNICIPYSKNFVKIVKGYIKEYKPKLTIIHSTVPPGTTRKLKAVHSPIHGRHPNLADGIRTFIKYVGGVSLPDTLKARTYLQNAGINAMIVPDPETSELSKIYCTTQYGWDIMIMREIHEACKHYGADFEFAYRLWNQFYSEGYAKLGFPQFKRYSLEYMPGKVGGHCVINNAKVLKKSKVAKLILKENDRF